MEIVVVGPGAVGSLLGGLLRAMGHGVTLVGRGGKTADPGRGMRIRLRTGWINPVGFHRAAPANAALAMIALGRQDLAALKKGGLALPAGAGHALFLNCEPGDPQRLGLSPGTWSLGLTLFTAVKLQDRDVELHGAGPAADASPPTVIVEKRCPAAAALRGLRSYGITVAAVDDAAPALDALLVSRLLELPAALCGTTIGHFLSYPEGRELAAALLSEGIAAMERAGRPLARLPVADPRELRKRLERRPADFDRLRDAPDRAYPPMLQAFLLKRTTEARELNRRVVELASAAGLSLTWNWRLFQKAGRPASVGFFRDPAALTAAVR